MLCKDFVSTSYRIHPSAGTQKPDKSAYLVDAAYTETKCATLDSCAVHVVTDQEDQLCGHI